MTLLDKVIGAVTPPESDEERVEARAKARAAAIPGGWLSMVLDHHVAIEAAFASVKSAPNAFARSAAQRQLAALLTGHSIAEEAVLYPALALNGEKAHATKAYTEQSAAKVQISALEYLDPMSEDYDDKFEHLRGAVLHHVYEEEGNWYIDLQEKLDAEMQEMITSRYQEEFDRYMSSIDAMGAPEPFLSEPQTA